MKNPETTNMQPESEEAEVKLNVSIQKDIQEENRNNEAVKIELVVNKEFVDDGSSEQIRELQIPTNTLQEVVSVENEIVLQEKEELPLENNTITKEVEEQEDNDIKLTFEADQSPVKNEEERSSNKQSKDENEEDLSPVQIENELKNGINEEEVRPSEIQTNNESYSEDIVESTTCDVSEMQESVTQSDAQNKAKIDDIVNNDTSFVSYDPSIMLKNVQIRLNDCLKENSNLFDVSNKSKDIELKISKYLTKEVSFGKTLKDISGRRMIRLRDTPRERRISSNSSLYVNTSMISQDEGTESKALHYTFSDSFPTNGSQLDRKRKIDAEEYSTMKKQKMDGNSSLLNRSTNLMKNICSPYIMKVSTPKAASFNFEPSKLDISGIKDDDNKITAESIESTKKWCVIM